MDIDEEYCEHIKISSEYAICSNPTKNINDQTLCIGGCWLIRKHFLLLLSQSWCHYLGSIEIWPRD